MTTDLVTVPAVADVIDRGRLPPAFQAALDAYEARIEAARQAIERGEDPELVWPTELLFPADPKHGEVFRVFAVRFAALEWKAREVYATLDYGSDMARDELLAALLPNVGDHVPAARLFSAAREASPRWARESDGDLILILANEEPDVNLRWEHGDLSWYELPEPSAYVERTDASPPIQTPEERLRGSARTIEEARQAFVTKTVDELISDAFHYRAARYQLRPDHGGNPDNREKVPLPSLETMRAHLEANGYRVVEAGEPVPADRGPTAQRGNKPHSARRKAEAVSLEDAVKRTYHHFDRKGLKPTVRQVVAMVRRLGGSGQDGVISRAYRTYEADPDDS